MPRWIWVSLPYATFGIAVENGVVVEAAPIARKSVGRPEREVAAYYRRQGAVFRDLPDPVPRSWIEPGRDERCSEGEVSGSRLTLEACAPARPGHPLKPALCPALWRGDSGAGVCPGGLSHPLLRLPLRESCVKPSAAGGVKPLDGRSRALSQGLSRSSSPWPSGECYGSL